MILQQSRVRILKASHPRKPIRFSCSKHSLRTTCSATAAPSVQLNQDQTRVIRDMAQIPPTYDAGYVLGTVFAAGLSINTSDLAKPLRVQLYNRVHTELFASMLFEAFPSYEHVIDSIHHNVSIAQEYRHVFEPFCQTTSFPTTLRQHDSHFMRGVFRGIVDQAKASSFVHHGAYQVATIVSKNT